MNIVGLGHYSRTGKDTTADFLIKKLNQAGFTAKKSPFAWKVKQIAFDLYAWDGMREPTFYDTEEGAPYRDIVLPTVGKTPVQLWIDIGTPAFRENVYDRTWIDYNLKTDHNVDFLIIPDCRFWNEFYAIRDAGGLLVKVVRPGYGPRNSKADTELLNCKEWDFVIGGDGKIESLEEFADQYVRCALRDEMPIQHREDREWNMSKEVYPIPTEEPTPTLSVVEKLMSYWRKNGA